MFLIIKLAVFVYFFPSLPHSCGLAVSGVHGGSQDTYSEGGLQEEWNPLIRLQRSLPLAQEVPKKAHCPLSTSPAQNPPNQHKGPPDKARRNQQRREE